MAEISISLDKRSIKKDGSYPVKIIVYFDRENKRYGLGKKISLTEQQWEKINSKNLKNEELLVIKKYLESEKGRAVKIIEAFGNEFSYELFEAFFMENKLPKQANPHKLYSIFEDYILELRKEERLGTAESYESALKSIKKFAPDLSIKDLTPKFLEKYEQWMLDNGYSITTITPCKHRLFEDKRCSKRIFC